MSTYSPHSHWHGIYVAAVTPLTPTGQIDVAALPVLLDFYTAQGCHGVLLCGTTGEGPSFSLRERQPLIDAAGAYRAAHPDLRILFGVGTPTLDDTIALTRASYAAGLDGVLCLPPYFFKSPSPAGLMHYFSAVIEAAVPEDRGGFFFYHIPQVAGVGVPFETIRPLLERYPNHIAGIKDSSGDVAHALALCAQFPQMRVFPGSPAVKLAALAAGAAGSITALANVGAPALRAMYDAHRAGQATAAHDAAVMAAHRALNAGPVIPGLKYVLHRRFGLPHWPVRPPFEALADGADLPLDAYYATLSA